MPIATKCPGCKALFRLADDLAGKKVRCQKCGQLFAVPRPKSALPVPPAPPPAASAPVPPILMSLDEPPLVNPPPAEVIEPTLVETPKPVEVVEAALVVPARVTPEIIDATLAEEGPAPARSRRRPADSPSKPAAAPRPRRAADLPKHSTFASGALAVLVFALLGALIVAGFAGGTWLLLKRERARAEQINLDKNKNRKAAVPPAAEPKGEKFGDFLHPLPLDANDKAMADGNVPRGSVSVYRVFLQQNQRYNLLVVGNGFLPRVRVQDGDQVLAAREGETRNLLSFMPVRTGDHTIRVSNPQFAAGNFTLSFTRADAAPSTEINLAGKPIYQAETTLRIEDPVCEEFHYGPCRQYTLHVKPGENYRFRVIPFDFQPVLRLQNGGILVKQLLAQAIGALEYIYTVQPGVNVLSIQVSSVGNTFGKYTLLVTRLEEERPGPRK